MVSLLGKSKLKLILVSAFSFPNGMFTGAVSIIGAIKKMLEELMQRLVVTS